MKLIKSFKNRIIILILVMILPSPLITFAQENAAGYVVIKGQAYIVQDSLKKQTYWKKEWWMAEYPELIQAVETSNNRTLSTNYQTGSSGEAEVKLTLTRKSNDGLVLKLNLPRHAIFSVDSKTGEKIPSSILPVITIRDHNQDGIPDDFKMEPSGEPLYEETVTEDGFIKFRSGPDHQSIWTQWSIGIGYSVNHFLHGFDSALPRK